MYPLRTVTRRLLAAAPASSCISWVLSDERWDAALGARYVRALVSQDCGAKAASYVDVFMQAIRWNNAERLYVQLANKR